MGQGNFIDLGFFISGSGAKYRTSNSRNIYWLGTAISDVLNLWIAMGRDENKESRGKNVIYVWYWKRGGW